MLADFRAYADAQDAVARAYAETPRAGRARRSSTSPGWAGSRSDRTIHEYAQDIWGISSVPVNL